MENRIVFRRISRCYRDGLPHPLPKRFVRTFTEEKALFAFLTKLGVLLIFTWVVVTILFLLSYKSGALAEGTQVDDRPAG